MKKLIRFYPFLLLVFVVFLFRFYMFEPYQVLSSEMAPTLLKGDYLIVKKYVYGLRLPFSNRYLWNRSKPKRGEVILFKSPYLPKFYMIRRVVAVPGDRLFYSGSVLFINEKAYPARPPHEVKKEWEFLIHNDFPGENETGSIYNYVHWQEELSRGPYSVLLEKDPKISFGPYKIPPHHYFVMGDHRSQSRDSRTWPSYSQPATGTVVFYRKKEGNFSDVIEIPKGTVLFVNEDSYFPLFFKTQNDVVLDKESVRVSMKALHPGLSGNILKGAVWKIQNFPNDQIIVQNEEDFFGGKDQSLIHHDSIYGQPWRIVWGCEKSLPFFKILCHFHFFRQGRWFWPVHKD